MQRLCVSKSLTHSAQVAEFPNLWIKTKFGLRQFSVRGVAKVRTESLWVALTYDLLSGFASAGDRRWYRRSHRRSALNTRSPIRLSTSHKLVKEQQRNADTIPGESAPRGPAPLADTKCGPTIPISPAKRDFFLTSSVRTQSRGPPRRSLRLSRTPDGSIYPLTRS